MSENKPTVAERREYLDRSAVLVARILEATAKAGIPDSAVSLTLKDDREDTTLMRFTAPGMRWLIQSLDRHKCGPSHDGDDTCPMLYLAWVIQGCQMDGETAAEAMKRNGVTIERRRP